MRTRTALVLAALGVASLASLASLASCQAILGIEDPVGQPCTLFGTECGAGRACDHTRVAGELACRDTGAGGVGAHCEHLEDCAANLSCVDARCRSLCVAGDSSRCDAGAGEDACLDTSGGYRTCDNRCDPIANSGCGNGQDCDLDFNLDGVLFTVCVPADYFGGKGPGETCTYLSECRAHLACRDPDGDGVGACVTLCAEGAMCPDASACPADLGAVQGVTYGLCPS